MWGRCCTCLQADSAEAAVLTTLVVAIWRADQEEATLVVLVVRFALSAMNKNGMVYEC